MKGQTDKQVIAFAVRIARLSIGTTGWTSDLAWAVRRAIEQYVKREFGITVRHVPYKSHRRADL